MDMWVIIDIAVVAIFIVCAVIGMIKGLLNTVMHAAAFILSGTAVIMFTVPVYNYMMGTTVPVMIQQHIQPSIVAAAENAAGHVMIDEAVGSMGLPDFASDFIEKSIDTSMIAEDLAATVTDAAVNGVMKIFSALIIFIGVQLVLTIIIFIINRMLEDPVLGGFNRMLGATLGVVNAMLAVYVLCAAVMLLAPFTELGGITDAIQNTFITKSFYNNNILMNLFLRGRI